MNSKPPEKFLYQIDYRKDEGGRNVYRVYQWHRDYGSGVSLVLIKDYYPDAILMACRKLTQEEQELYMAGQKDDFPQGCVGNV